MMQKSNHGGTIGKIYDHVDPVVRWNTSQKTSRVYRTSECDGMSDVRGRSSRSHINLLRKKKWRHGQTGVVS